MPMIDAGVREIRNRDGIGAYRVIYIATLADAIHVFARAREEIAKDREAGPGAWRRATTSAEMRI